MELLQWAVILFLLGGWLWDRILNSRQKAELKDLAKKVKEEVKEELRS